MTGCGCALLIALIVGLITFMVFGSTDPGEPVDAAVALLAALSALGVAQIPIRRALVRARGA
ncbi:MAG TPA: hypothetical protein VFV20_02690 [Candidatus Limnocylindria bacterium]|nr:hypothetical protein [Candidatus Limnocylindria bacterium]